MVDRKNQIWGRIILNEAVIEVKGLKKSYKGTPAVKGVDFTVARGEVFGLLGPNGAGKTTTLECIEGVRLPDAGHIRVACRDPRSGGRAFRRVLGVQLQSSGLPDSIKVSEALKLVCAYQGVAPRGDLVEEFGLGPMLKKTYHNLSTGQKRRLLLALSLVSSPQAVVLDEPTAGLDVEGRASLHAAVKKLRASGVTVLLATHDMAEAEELCDRIAILIRGSIAVTGTPEQITAAAGTRTNIMIRTASGCLSETGPRDGEDGYRRYVTDDAAGFLLPLLKKITDSGDRVCDLRVERPSLEERFLEIVKGGAAE